jgi:MFS family permease
VPRGTRGAEGDRRIIFAASFLRAVANGLIGVVAGIYLAQLGFEPAVWGAVLGAGLAGTAIGAAGVMFWGDRLGRKRWLVALGVLAATGGIVFALSSQIVVLGAAAFLGMLNSLGKDRAAALALEQAILPSMGEDAGRTRAFAWYNVVQDVGHALGAGLAAVSPFLRDFFGLAPLASLRGAVILYALLYAFTAVLYLGLSRRAEAPVAALQVRVAPQSRAILKKMSFLFALDSFAGGFQGSALFAYFFHAQFGASEGTIGLLFVGARVMNAFSHLGAAWLSARIGLVNTMVFTHTPSSLLTFTIPFTGSFGIAAVLFLLREGLSEMDVPTRQSYLMAVVRPEERTFAGGVTNLARMCARAIAPVFAGSAIQALALGAPIMAAAGLKILYDALLYVSFRKLKAPEER